MQFQCRSGAIAAIIPVNRPILREMVRKCLVPPVSRAIVAKKTWNYYVKKFFPKYCAFLSSSCFVFFHKISTLLQFLQIFTISNIKLKENLNRLVDFKNIDFQEIPNTISLQSLIQLIYLTGNYVIWQIIRTYLRVRYYSHVLKILIATEKTIPWSLRLLFVPKEPSLDRSTFSIAAMVRSRLGELFSRHTREGPIRQSWTYNRVSNSDRYEVK